MEPALVVLGSLEGGGAVYFLSGDVIFNNDRISCLIQTSGLRSLAVGGFPGVFIKRSS